MKDKISVLIDGKCEFICYEMIEALSFAHENGIGKKVTFKIEKVSLC